MKADVGIISRQIDAHRQEPGTKAADGHGQAHRVPLNTLKPAVPLRSPATERRTRRNYSENRS